jgi:hypothetical protein
MSHDLFDLEGETMRKVLAGMGTCKEAGIDSLVTYTSRTAEQQADLWKIGRFVGGSIVTNCDGVTRKSWHQVRRAVDFAVIRGKSVFYSAAALDSVAHIMKGHGLEWGGDWSGDFKDYPHFEWRVCKHGRQKDPAHFADTGLCA